MALGLERAGFTHVFLNEYDSHAAATLRHNRPHWPVNVSDIRDLDFRHLAGGIDLLEGGFPCQPFSLAGKRLGFRDTRGLLFFEFARAVHQIQPKVAVGENVQGLVSHDGGLTLKLMAATLQLLGYHVAYRTVQAEYFDVPQRRHRLLLLAVRQDQDIPLLFPKARGYQISLRSALAACPPSEGVDYPESRKRVLALVPEGGNWRDLPDSIRRQYVGSDADRGSCTGLARRLSWNQPSPTLLTAPIQRRTDRCHPEEVRPLTIRECARIQTFPDDWAFTGPVGSQYRQIGNAVPVNLAFHIGSAVTAMLGRGEVREFEGLVPMARVVRGE